MSTETSAPSAAAAFCTRAASLDKAFWRTPTLLQRKGVRVVRLSTKPRHDRFEKCTSPRGRVYYWPDWRQLEEDDEGTDVWAFVRGYITVTAMTLDVTAVAEMKQLIWLETPLPPPLPCTTERTEVRRDEYWFSLMGHEWESE